MNYKGPNWKDFLAIMIAVAGAINYRIGGSAMNARWDRPVAMGVGTFLILCLLFGFHWSIILSAGASAGLSTTYFKKKGSEAKWWNWLIAGVAMSLAILPWAIFTHHLIGFAVRTVVLIPATVLWCQIIGNAVIEELGRGALFLITLFLLLIGG